MNANEISFISQVLVEDKVDIEGKKPHIKTCWGPIDLLVKIEDEDEMAWDAARLPVCLNEFPLQPTFFGMFLLW